MVLLSQCTRLTAGQQAEVEGARTAAKQHPYTRFEARPKSFTTSAAGRAAQGVNMSDGEKSTKKEEPRYAISVIAKPLAGKKLTKKLYKLTSKGTPPLPPPLAACLASAPLRRPCIGAAPRLPCAHFAGFPYRSLTCLLRFSR